MIQLHGTARTERTARDCTGLNALHDCTYSIQAFSNRSLFPPQTPPSGEPPDKGCSPGIKAIPWAQWKADELNRLFQEQSSLRKPARITAETVTHGMKCLSASTELGPPG